MTDLAELLSRVCAATGPDRELDVARLKLEALCEPDTNGGCSLWAGPVELRAIDMRPRAFIHALGKRWLAHRLAYYVASRADPGRGFVCHTCDNAWCINPGHLYLGDHASNMADMKRRRRYFAAREPERARAILLQHARAITHTRGEGNPKCRLTAAEADNIKVDRRKTKVVAAAYGVHRTTIQRIRRGAIWKTS